MFQKNLGSLVTFVTYANSAIYATKTAGGTQVTVAGSNLKMEPITR